MNLSNSHLLRYRAGHCDTFCELLGVSSECMVKREELSMLVERRELATLLQPHELYTCLAYRALREEVLPRVPRTRHSGKRSPSPSARARHSGKYLFFCFFCPIFLWGLQTLFKTPCPNLAYLWIFLLYFFSFFLFLEFLSTLQIWTTGTWNHIIWRFKKMTFIIFGVYWGLIHQLTWNIEHLVVVTWLTTYGKSVSKLQKIRTKSEIHETCRGVVLSHV
jgi:hypothetical protein